MNFHIKSAIFNRKKIQKILNNEIIVLIGRNNIIRTNDCFYSFRQFSNFLYFTSINEPQFFCIITPLTDILFIPKKTKKYIIWDGNSFTKKEYKKVYKFNKVYYNDQFNEILKKLSKKFSSCYIEKENLSILTKLNSTIKLRPKKFSNLISKFRSKKSEIEIQLIKHISQITSNAFIKTIKKAKSGIYEYQIQNYFESELFKNNVRDTAFPTIVASGINSSILHYTKNSSILNPKQLCLLDAGGEYYGYASDITRTFPISKKFNKIQKDIYNIVLKTQIECIKALKSNIYLKDIHNISIDNICLGLFKLKIFKGKLNEIITKKIYKLFYPHGIGHLLGLDTHDIFYKAKKSKDLRSNVLLQSNFVITVEPGIYFNKFILNDTKTRKKFQKYINWNIVDKYMSVGGIRIEDNVVITNNGCINLTNVPKEIKDIEGLKKR